MTGKQTAEHKVTLRVTNTVMQRADKIRARAEKDPKTLGRITVSAILKRALEIGLDSLERQQAGK